MESKYELLTLNKATLRFSIGKEMTLKDFVECKRYAHEFLFPGTFMLRKTCADGSICFISDEGIEVKQETVVNSTKIRACLEILKQKHGL